MASPASLGGARHPPHESETQVANQGIEWVSDEQKSDLTVRHGAAEWPAWLRARLAEAWPGWEHEDGVALREWLDAELASPDEDSGAAAASLEWLTDEHRALLGALAGDYGPIATWLPAQLDEWWPEWRGAKPDTLVAFLDQWLPTLQPERDQGPDVRDLAWLTPGQHEILADLAGSRGPWEDWLPRQLSAWWPEWVMSTPDELAVWLDGWLPTLQTEHAQAPMETVGVLVSSTALNQYSEEEQALLMSEDGQAAIGRMLQEVAALLEENPEFADISPERREELLLRAVRDQLVG